MPEIDNPLVWGFPRPHRVGSVCAEPCEQCGGPTKMVDPFGNFMPDSPLYILGEATVEDHIASNRRRGGNGQSLNSGYHYFVSTD